ncbi:hypothetical protein Acr_00g0077660 [Actinidia rufa]|uniref:Uncharacterized protein n=1 Tax=Actinidia rufa TaxID=165716 RepID=A0A7J0DTP1_9ERIC|nr:hypothetical protein Acr_00g0077660 [Actinidia rufa]
MEGNSLHLLVILLAFSHLISTNAVMASRTRPDFLTSEDTNQIMATEEIVKAIMGGRMLEDYETKPNQHHTPKLPPGARD